MNTKFLHNTLLTFQLDLLLAAFTNLRFLQSEGFFGILNFILSSSIVILYFGTIVISFGKFRMINLFDSQTVQELTHTEKYIRSGLKNWDFLKEELNPGLNGFWQYFMQFQMLKEFLISFFVIVFIQNTYLQLVPLLILFTFTIVGLLVKKPFSKKLDNLFMAFVELMYFIIFGLFLVLHVKRDTLDPETKFKLYGYGICAIVAIVIISHLVLGIYSSI